MVFSFVFTTLRGMCSYHLLETSQPSTLTNEYSWPPYVGVNIQLMQPAVMWLMVSRPHHKLCNYHQSASLRSYNDSFFMLSFSITLLVFKVLTKANIYSLLPLLPSGEIILPSQPHDFFTSLQNLSLPCSI